LASFANLFKRRDTTRSSATTAMSKIFKKTENCCSNRVDVFPNPWLMCVTETVFFFFLTGDTPMANATARPTTADLLYARTAALELIEELHAAVKDMPILEAADREKFDRYFGELDDLHDAMDGLAAKLQRKLHG
jgi:hypothetical protein